MTPAHTPPEFLWLAIGGAVAVALAVLRWGRRGAVAGYLIGAAACLLAWLAAVFLATRLSGARPDALAPALGRGLTAIAVLTSLWLAVASAGVVAGALGRLLYLRLLARRRRPEPKMRPHPDRTARRRR